MPRKPSGNFDQAKYTRQFHEKAYDRLNLLVPKGRKADIERAAKTNGESVNGMANRLFKTEIGMTDEEWKHKGVDSEQAIE